MLDRFGGMLSHAGSSYLGRHVGPSCGYVYFGGTLAQLWALEVMLLEARSYVQAMLGILGLC